MKPLRKAVTPIAEHFRVYDQMREQWKAGHAAIRQAFPQKSEAEAVVAMYYFSLDTWATPVWMNETYQVAVRPVEPGGLHLSIKRNDRKPIHDWRDLQEIKNQIAGPECEAVELYPAESRRVDSANQYHLWAVTDPKFRFPFGFQERLISSEPLGKSVNRPFE